MKEQLHQHLLDLVSDKLDVINLAFAEKREDLLSESKSTAGDKHETGRAMIQLEQEKLSGQMLQLNAQLEILHRINPAQPSKTVRSGSLVHTDQGVFYLAIGIGPVKFDRNTYLCIAPTAPIGLAMLGKSVGEHVSFNGNRQEIRDIL